MMGRLLDLHPQYRVIADEIREEGRKEGRAEAKARIALKMYRSGIDAKMIEKCTGGGPTRSSVPRRKRSTVSRLDGTLQFGGTFQKRLIEAFNGAGTE